MFNVARIRTEASNALALQGLRVKFGGKRGLYEWLANRGKLSHLVSHTFSFQCFIALFDAIVLTVYVKALL